MGCVTCMHDPLPDLQLTIKKVLGLFTLMHYAKLLVISVCSSCYDKASANSVLQTKSIVYM